MPALLLVRSAAHSLQEHLERSVFFDDNKRRIGRQYICQLWELGTQTVACNIRNVVCNTFYPEGFEKA